MTMISHINQEMMTNSQILTDHKVTDQVSDEMIVVADVLSDHEMTVLDLDEVMIVLVLIVQNVQLIHCHNNYEERMKKRPAVHANSAPRRDSADKFNF